MECLRRSPTPWRTSNALADKFHAATGLDGAAVAQVQLDVRRRLLRAFVARGHLEAHDAKDMAVYAHGSGFSVDAGVHIEAPDRSGLERQAALLRPPSHYLWAALITSIRSWST